MLGAKKARKPKRRTKLRIIRMLLRTDETMAKLSSGRFLFTLLASSLLLDPAWAFSGRSPSLRIPSYLQVGDAAGEYYGESGGNYMVKEFSSYDQLEEIVKLAAQPMPERPDGIVCVCRYTSAASGDCRATEAEYERLARKNPATIFLRCFAEYQDAALLHGQAKVTIFPTFDLFYRGNRVARVEGTSYTEVEDLLERYQFQNTNLDLFSEAGVAPWGDGKVRDPTKTPRTTARFLPGYDWDSDRGFFDDAADKAQSDFENTFGNWLPNTEDE